MSNQSKTPDPQSCRWEESIPAFVQGELDPAERVPFEDHLASCPSCRRRVSETRSLLDRLRQLPPVSPRKDLAPAIMARIPEDAWSARPGVGKIAGKRFTTFRRLSAVAASLVAAVVGLSLYLGYGTDQTEVPGPAPPAASTRSTPPPVQREEVVMALEWLAAAQEPNGSWDPARWGGRPQFEVGLSALALIAFLNSGFTEEGGRFHHVVSSGLDFLLQQQDPGGRFGPSFSGSLYNHGIASIALIEAFASPGRTGLRMPIDRAITFIDDSQGPEGGWSASGAPGRPDPSVTAWQLQALLLAHSLGWQEADAPARGALKWLAARGGAAPCPQEPALSPTAAFCLFIDPQAISGPSARPAPPLPAPASVDIKDFNRLYFLSHALHMARSIHRGPAGSQARQLAMLDQALIDGQLKTGPDAGSWEPSGQWGTAGGRIFSTAMAALSLEAGHRTQRLLSLAGEAPH